MLSYVDWICAGNPQKYWGKLLLLYIYIWILSCNFCGLWFFWKFLTILRWFAWRFLLFVIFPRSFLWGWGWGWEFWSLCFEMMVAGAFSFNCIFHYIMILQMAGKVVNIKLHSRRSQRVVEGSRNLCTCECRPGNITNTGSIISWIALFSL